MCTSLSVDNLPDRSLSPGWSCSAGILPYRPRVLAVAMSFTLFHHRHSGDDRLPCGSLIRNCGLPCRDRFWHSDVSPQVAIEHALGAHKLNPKLMASCGSQKCLIPTCGATREHSDDFTIRRGRESVDDIPIGTSLRIAWVLVMWKGEKIELSEKAPWISIEIYNGSSSCRWKLHTIFWHSFGSQRPCTIYQFFFSKTVMHKRHKGTPMRNNYEISRSGVSRMPLSKGSLSERTRCRITISPAPIYPIR